VDPSLIGVQAKLDRARDHLQALYDELNVFSASNPHELVREHDPETRTDDVFVKVLREPKDPEWGILLGDFLHNARCALDHLVWQLVLLNKAKPGRWNQFPIATHGAQYWSLEKDGRPSMRDRMLRGVAEEHRALIDAVQPYRRGREAKSDRLAILAEFSNTDKHRIVHPTLIGLMDPDFERDFTATAYGSEGFAEVELHNAGPIEDGAKVMTVRYVTDDPEARVKMDANLPVGIGFGETGLKVTVLGEILVDVRDVIGQFVPFF
jgi:hypothetical protein